MGPSCVPPRTYELLSKIAGRGLVVRYGFARAPHLYSSKMVSLQLFFDNQGSEDLTDVIADKKVRESVRS